VKYLKESSAIIEDLMQLNARVANIALTFASEAEETFDKIQEERASAEQRERRKRREIKRRARRDRDRINALESLVRRMSRAILRN
jgi:hypothetical protein